METYEQQVHLTTESSTVFLAGEGGSTRNNDLYGEVLPERGTFFMQASGIWKGKDLTCWSIWKGRDFWHFYWWKDLKRITDAFYGWENVLVLRSIHILKIVHLQQLELRDVKFQTRYMEGATFVNGMYTGYLSVKNGIYERALGVDLGAEPPRIKRFWVYPWGFLSSSFNLWNCRLKCGTKFLPEFIFADWTFFVFFGNQFLRTLQIGFSRWEVIFAIFRKNPGHSIDNIFLFGKYVQ